MPVVAVDKDGSETIFETKPFRDKGKIWNTNDDFVQIPKGTIQKIIERKLTWEDGPVELKEG